MQVKEKEWREKGNEQKKNVLVASIKMFTLRLKPYAGHSKGRLSFPLPFPFFVFTSCVC